MNEPVRGLNHLTLAVADLEVSIGFYRDLLGFALRAQWSDGAYLEAGALWLCLARGAATPAGGYTHVALDIDAADFASVAARIRAAAPLWQANRSEGESLYFCDPDGHRLELHVGSLATRLARYRAQPPPGMVFFDSDSPIPPREGKG